MDRSPEEEAHQAEANHVTALQYAYKKAVQDVINLRQALKEAGILVD